MDFKNIHIGQLIEQKCLENKMDFYEICKILNCDENFLKKTFLSQSIESELLLKLSKILGYDFFRVYSQHILLFTPARNKKTVEPGPKSSEPVYTKNIYTQEIIKFILDSVNSGEKTKNEIIEQYRIPKTTLYKWLSKYNNDKNNEI